MKWRENRRENQMKWREKNKLRDNRMNVMNDESTNIRQDWTNNVLITQWAWHTHAGTVRDLEVWFDASRFVAGFACKIKSNVQKIRRRQLTPVRNTSISASGDSTISCSSCNCCGLEPPCKHHKSEICEICVHTSSFYDLLAFPAKESVLSCALPTELNRNVSKPKYPIYEKKQIRVI